MGTVTIHTDLRAQEKKICHFSPLYFHEVMGQNAMFLVFLMLSFKPDFSLFHSHKEAL